MSRVQMLVAEAKAQINELMVDEVYAGLANDEPFILIDIREDSEWIVAQLPEALHMSRGKLEFMIEQVAPEIDTKLVLYCGSGFRSVLAAESLQKMGYNNVYSMAGGYGQWKQANYPIVSE